MLAPRRNHRGHLCVIKNLFSVIPGRRAAGNPESMNTRLWKMGSGFAAFGRAPE